MKSVIWLPSKSRPNPSFSQKLSSEGLDHTIWVEPQDYDNYRNSTTCKHVTLQRIPKDNQGVTYVRQLMLDFAREESHQAWMMDDDINGFFRMLPVREGIDKARRRVALTINDALSAAENKFVANSLTYGCLIHNAFAIFGAPGLNFRKLDYGSVWIDGAKYPKTVNYNSIPGREDLYLAVQLVLDGNLAACDNDISVNHRPSADPKAKGGLADWYADWEANVLPANSDLESRLDVLMKRYVDRFDVKSQKQFVGRKLYRRYAIAHGPRKGSIDTRPSWQNIMKLRNAVYEGKLPAL